MYSACLKIERAPGLRGWQEHVCDERGDGLGPVLDVSLSTGSYMYPLRNAGSRYRDCESPLRELKSVVRSRTALRLPLLEVVHSYMT